MGFYAAPSYKENTVSLTGGLYNPPEPNSLVILSRSGGYDYAPSLYNNIIALLQYGYSSPSDQNHLVVLSKSTGDVQEQYIYGLGYDANAFGEPKSIISQFIGASSFWSSTVTSPGIRLNRRYITNLHQSSAKQVMLSASDLYIEKNLPDIVVLTTYGEELRIGSQRISKKNNSVEPFSLFSGSVSSKAFVINNSQFVRILAIEPEIPSSPIVQNVNKELLVASILSSTFGVLLAFNLRQIVKTISVRVDGFYGSAYLQGGVRQIYPQPINSIKIGELYVTNTTANQTVRIDNGIRPIAPPEPILTPHMIYAGGIYDTSFGSAKLIPTPVLRHKGVNQMVDGTPTVWFRVRKIGATGFESYASGYTHVFDPTQFVQQAPFVRIAVFGDTYLKKKWSFLAGVGAIDDLSVSPWSVIENKNRRYDLKGFESQSLGRQSIRNKTPSIFFNGINPPLFYQPAIGHRIRKVFAVGFDRLAFGAPILIKTPEILLRGYDTSTFGEQWISNCRRYIENTGKDHSATSAPKVWFRYRYAEPNSWQSSNFSNSPTVTHGVRELIAQGFIRHGYGMAWVTPGVRLLAPESIYKNHTGAHYVGRHQDIKPQSFVATLFGTRIIPESKTVYPLGFIGKFGDNKAYLQKQYLKPKGYLSAGEQPAFRWGRQITYNKTSYIIQNFLGDSSLVPPKWSEWTAIANRNKVIGAIGTPMQKFGYSQVDNAARLTQPVGLLATKFDKSMIAARVRPLPIIGIEAPLMTSWHVAYNAARVIAPKGSVHTLAGNAEAVKTRRYYDRVGRIDSFEAGIAMIAYRIRRLEIEKRYSIAPPLINLPSVALYTRYVSFNGYETAKYGSPSLSIHFRIITPRWTHVEIVGSPALRNVTPELLTRGHDNQEYGDTHIRTQWHNVYAQGDSITAIGLLKISDTKQYISVRGFVDSLASQKHTVTQGESAPYSLQYIYLNDENNSSNGEGKGVEPPKPQVPQPYLNQNVIYHRNNAISSKFGTQFIWGNNLEVESGISVSVVSSGLKVYVSTQIVKLDDKGIVNKIELGKPRLSPHTIYAVKEAPLQAKQNHPANNLHYVGEFDDGKASSRVGNPLVESTIRTVSPTSFFSSQYKSGRPALDLVRKLVRADGFRLGRFGVPSIPFTKQDIIMRDSILNNMFGINAVTRPPYVGPQHIGLKGIYSTFFGATYADNYIRTLQARGSDSLAMGQRKIGDSPFMWQGLRVGEHVPTLIGAGDTSHYGDTVIDLRVRELGTEGFNAFRSEYSLEFFNVRMTISNADKKIPAKLTVKPDAISPNSNIGYQDVKYGQHYIRPDGNSNQFRKGGYHA